MAGRAPGGPAADAGGALRAGCPPGYALTAARAYPGAVPHPLESLMPEVADVVSDARRACDAVARRTARADLPTLRAEAALRAAHAGLALDGVRLSLDAVRDVARGVMPAPSGPQGLAVTGALRVAADVQRALVPSDEWTPTGQEPLPLPQRLARWHALATAGLGFGEPGRLRDAGQPGDPMGLGPAPVGPPLARRMAGLATLVAQPVPPVVSGVLVGAVVHAELLAMRPFPAANGVVARGVLRWQLASLGVDRAGLLVPEVVWAEAPERYLSAAAGYATGEWSRVVAWVRSVAFAVTRAADVALDLAEGVGRS